MKKIMCEMCASNDLVKQDGYYVCQCCGMKYSIDEAKKMMIDGTVDVKGTVKVDNSPFVEKYLANARRAKEKEDWEEVEKYYNMVEQNDPTNIEAIFYSAYGKAKSALVDGDIYKREAAFKVLQNCISIVDDNFDMDDEENQRAIIKKIGSDILSMSCSNFVYTRYTKQDQLGITHRWDDKKKTEALFIELKKEFCTTLEEIIKKYPENDKRLVDYYNMLLLNTDSESQTQRYHERLHIIDPSHDIPTPKNLTEKTKKDACYVATAVYGSYDCPEVWTLRRYRDFTLSDSWYGRAFIRTYYAISPTLVKWFGHTAWFKKMWKGKLDKMVRTLNENGVENTPYVDREW